MTSSLSNMTTTDFSLTGTPALNLTDTVGGCKVVYRNMPFLPWNNPHNLISVQTQLLVTKSVAVFVTFICTLGFALNLVNCVVFAKLGLRDRINFLLFSNSCADVVACVYYVLHTIEYTYSLFLGDLRGYGPLGVALVNNGGNTLHGSAYVSRLISTLIACERCLCITSPFIAKKFLKTRTAGIIVGLASLILMGLHSLVALKFKVGCEYIPAIRASITTYYASEFYHNHPKLIDTLNVAVFAFTLPCFFLVATTLTTAITAVKLKRASSWRNRASTVPTMETKEMAVTKMLVAVSCVFILCSLPNILSRIISLFAPGMKLGGRNQNVHMVTVALLYLFNAINSSVNFIFYYKMGSSFRRILRGVCVGCSEEQSISTDQLCTAVTSASVGGTETL
ncbi:succinate receptor 1-like [Littorina saxatilis]|uniref:succinate receptor 1-like n=1 Tax=Littorina saxatilis TaxID=31220 RepID=UPI0038B67CB9